MNFSGKLQPTVCTGIALFYVEAEGSTNRSEIFFLPLGRTYAKGLPFELRLKIKFDASNNKLRTAAPGARTSGFHDFGLLLVGVGWHCTKGWCSVAATLLHLLAGVVGYS